MDVTSPPLFAPRAPFRNPRSGRSAVKRASHRPGCRGGSELFATV